MAQLVTFKTKPHKYYKKEEEKLLPVNYIISDNNNHFFEGYLEKINLLISTYVNNAPLELARATHRGAILKCEINIAEIITLAVIWQRNIRRETQACYILAKNIADHITTANLAFFYKQEIQKIIFNNLRQFFYIKIYIQEHLISKILKLEDIKYIIHASNYELKIFLNKKSHTVDLHNLDMSRIVARVIKNLRHASS
jgi:hypothetical protein